MIFLSSQTKINSNLNELGGHPNRLVWRPRKFEQILAISDTLGDHRNRSVS